MQLFKVRSKFVKKVFYCLFYCIAFSLIISCSTDAPGTKVDNNQNIGVEDNIQGNEIQEGEVEAVGKISTKQQVYKPEDKDWPENVGDAVICTWKDDKLAAFTVTIDDNMVHDHAWWIEQGNNYDVKFTWFIITNWINNIINGDGGEWADFQILHDLGHDIQSHTVSHLRDDNLSIHDEYGNSIIYIENNINGAKVQTLSYPGLPGNDQQVAAEYYIGARGAATKINTKTPVNHMEIKVIEKINLTNSSQGFTYLPNMLNKDSMYYKGWYCTLFHGVSSPYDVITDCLNYVTDPENDIWVGTFTEVIKYVRERDNAVITSSILDNQIRLNLSDDFENDKFDMPLTIKVKINNQWNEVSLNPVQAVINEKIVEYNNEKYLILSIKPDSGKIIISEKN